MRGRNVALEAALPALERQVLLAFSRASASGILSTLSVAIRRTQISRCSDFWGAAEVSGLLDERFSGPLLSASVISSLSGFFHSIIEWTAFELLASRVQLSELEPFPRFLVLQAPALAASLLTYPLETLTTRLSVMTPRGGGGCLALLRQMREEMEEQAEKEKQEEENEEQRLRRRQREQEREWNGRKAVVGALFSGVGVALAHTLAANGLRVLLGKAIQQQMGISSASGQLALSVGAMALTEVLLHPLSTVTRRMQAGQWRNPLQCFQESAREVVYLWTSASENSTSGGVFVVAGALYKGALLAALYRVLHKLVVVRLYHQGKLLAQALMR